MDIAKAYPNPVNVDGLIETVSAIYPNVSRGDNGFRVHNIAPENAQFVSDDLDAIIANHEPTELTLEQQAKIEDATERQNLLTQYNAALVQIANDVSDTETGETALQSATTLAQVKPIVAGMLTLFQHQLQREARMLKALRAVLRDE